MSRYTIKEGKFGDFRTVILEDSLEGTRAEIALRGAHLLSLKVPGKGKLTEILDGYQTPQELTEQSGARSCIMAPFSNRISKGAYTFQGMQNQMVNPVNPKRGVIHGLARVLDFKIKEQITDENKAEVLLFSDYIRKGSFPGYPYCVDIYVRFILKTGRLGVEISGKNVGVTDAPFGCGWHPYFKTGENGLNHLKLEIPARKIVEINDEYLPLEGDAAFSPVSKYPELTFAPENSPAEKVMGERIVNACFTELIPGEDGIIRTSITDEQEGLKISVCQTEGVVYVFSGDEVKYRPRKAIAIEPVQYITDSYNRPELKESIRLKPGSVKTFSFQVEFTNL